MDKNIIGQTFVFNENIDTDQIYPGRFLAFTNPDEVGKYAMHGADPNMVNEFKPGDIIVASSNFGCGSSREHAVVTLKAIGVGALIADSYARIFYRNAINLGIPAIVCPGLRAHVSKGDRLDIDMQAGVITNLSSGQQFNMEPMSEYSMRILEHGGIKKLAAKQLEELDNA